MSSLWQADTQFRKFPKLNRDIKTDVLIIGGGIAGILCAHKLKNDGVDYILVEAGRVCSSTTANTTAKITSQHSLIYNKIEKEFGTEYALKYLLANESAIREYHELSEIYDCDFEIKDSYVYSENNYSKLEKELDTLSKITDIASLCNNLEIPVENVGAVKFSNQAQFNPLSLLSQITVDLNIYENTKILSIEDNIAYTDTHKIIAENIIIATHFPFINNHGIFFLKMYQHRSYTIAVENADKINGMYVDEDKKGLSFRGYGNYLIIGGGGHRTGKKSCVWKELEHFAKSSYKGSQIAYRWAAQDCITLDGMPYIGKCSNRTSNLFVITGFNKWGMTTSMAGASILSDIIQGRNNEYGDLFSPSRTILRPQLAVNSFEAVKNLCTPTTKRCTHLGCALKWNKAEHSWDCECHGSRFNEEGSILNNPANRELKKE